MNHTTFIVRVFEAAEVLPSDDLVRLLRTMLGYLERRYPALPGLEPDSIECSRLTANRDHTAADEVRAAPRTADSQEKGAGHIRPDDDSEGTFVEGWESLYV